MGFGQQLFPALEPVWILFAYLVFHWQTWLNNSLGHMVWQQQLALLKHVYPYQSSPSASWSQDLYCLLCKQFTGIAAGCCYSHYSCLFPHIQHVQTYLWKHHLVQNGNRQNDGVSLRQHCIRRWWRQIQGLYLPGCPTHWSKWARPSPLFIHPSPVILPFCYCQILIHPLSFAPFFHITQLAWVPHHQSSHVLAHWCIQCPMPTITHIHHCFHNHIHICICIHIHVLIHTLTIALRLTTVPYMHSHTHFCILSVALWVLTHALVCTTLTHSLTFTFTHQHLYHDSQHLPALTKTHLVLVPSADIITVTWSQVHLTSSSCGWRVGGLDLGHFHWCWTVLVLFWWSLLLLLLPLSLYYLLWKLSCHWWLVFLWSSLVMVPGPQLIWPIGSVQLKDCS